MHTADMLGIITQHQNEMDDTQICGCVKLALENLHLLYKSAVYSLERHHQLLRSFHQHGQ